MLKLPPTPMSHWFSEPPASGAEEIEQSSKSWRVVGSERRDYITEMADYVDLS